MGVDVLVAPYEADAQLAFLSRSNIAQIIVTEDSDLILFGCKRIIFKLKIDGSGYLFDEERFSGFAHSLFATNDSIRRFRW